MQYTGNYVKLLKVLLLACFLLSQSATAKMTTIEFQDAAAEVMMNALQKEPSSSFLRRLYTRLLFVPVWVDESGMTPYAKEFFTQIHEDGTLEKSTQLYRDALKLEEEAHFVGTSLADKLSLEFKISQLYKGYADYSIYGSINWGAFLARLWNRKTEDVHADWVTYKPQIDPIMVLEDTVLSGSFTQAFDKAIPRRYRYRELQQALAHYIQLKESGGWQPVILAHKKLKPGMEDAGLVSLEKRLSVTGDYHFSKEDNRSTLYTQDLVDAVKRFQKRNGLLPDGVIGGGTLRVLNRSVEDRILTLRLNLDRIKWLRDPPKGKHVVINIPAFMLYFEENGRLLQKIKVIVGKRSNPTPIFSDTVEAIVLNPYWNIPKSIIQKEMIPKLLKNPYALRKKGIEIFTSWGANAKPIDPASVDWAKYRYSNTVPFRFAQLPGKRNALGKIKFLFPNQFSVYMHDTPNKRLFKRNVRAFSHGCIRLSQPRELLKTFSTFEPNVDFEKSQKILKSKKKTYLNLPNKIPVDIAYLTVWIDYDGKLQFRNDIYHYDKMQLQAYRKW